MEPLQIVELVEYEPKELASLPDEAERLLQERYPGVIDVTPPSFATHKRWRLSSQGWAGYIPLLPNLHLRLTPKLPWANLFAMLEYAYNLKSFRFLDGLYACDSIGELVQRLAVRLCQDVLSLHRHGLYRAYEPRQESLPYVRGRIVFTEAVRRPWDASLPVHYEEHTSDIKDNQLLTWTLHQLGRLGPQTLREQRTAQYVRRAYRTMLGSTALVRCAAADCEERVYHRLNERYRPLHALCRFFLENSSPCHRAGDHETLPFLVNMGRLYEQCLTGWLAAHLPRHLRCRRQQAIPLAGSGRAPAAADLVISDARTGMPLCVLDAKYKIPSQPAPEDIYQIHYYAASLHCSRAVLVYPRQLPVRGTAHKVQGIHIQTATFAVAGDLEANGQRFLDELGLRAEGKVHSG